MAEKAAAIVDSYGPKRGGVAGYPHVDSLRRFVMMVLFSPEVDVAASLRERFAANLNVLLHVERAHGRSASQIAAQVGVAPSILSRWRLGAKFPRPDQIDKLADVLGIDIEFFFKKTDIPASASIEEAAERLNAVLGWHPIKHGKT